MGWTCVGVDGTKGGWIAACLSGGLAKLTRGSGEISEMGEIGWMDHIKIGFYPDIESLCAAYSDADCILIDIPIGLQESPQGLRPEAQLRKLLPGKASSVFTPPCRQAVYGRTYAEACAVNQGILGKKISLQAFHISNKIREVDEFLQREPAWRDRLREGHPEYGFAILNGGIPLPSNKKRSEGKAERLKLLDRASPPFAEGVRRSLAEKGIQGRTDDVLDAACLAAIAGLGMRWGFETVPAAPQRDSRGIPMRIVIPSETVRAHFARLGPLFEREGISLEYAGT